MKYLVINSCHFQIYSYLCSRLVNISTYIYLFGRESIFTKEIDISLAYWVRAAKVGANIRQIMLFVVSALSARYFSFKML